MSAQDQRPNQNEEMSDFEIRFLRDMERFYAPGGLFEIQNNEARANPPIPDESPNPPIPPPLETYVRVNSMRKC